jgi:Ca2+-binding RTX toxin-like protein
LTTGYVQWIRTVEAVNGDDDVIFGNQGRDRIFGGNGSDTSMAAPAPT